MARAFRPRHLIGPVGGALRKALVIGPSQANHFFQRTQLGLCGCPGGDCEPRPDRRVTSTRRPQAALAYWAPPGVHDLESRARCRPGKHPCWWAKSPGCVPWPPPSPLPHMGPPTFWFGSQEEDLWKLPGEIRIGFSPHAPETHRKVCLLPWGGGGGDWELAHSLSAALGGCQGILRRRGSSPS